MKARTNFVSNSSTSSFCIYGVYFDSVSELLDNNSKLKEAILEECPDLDPDEGDYAVIEVLEKLLDMQCIQPYDCGIYIGEEWSGIGDDETGREFKQNIRNNIRKYIDVPDKDFHTLEEAYYS